MSLFKRLETFLETVDEKAMAFVNASSSASPVKQVSAFAEFESADDILNEHDEQDGSEYETEEEGPGKTGEEDGDGWEVSAGSFSSEYFVDDMSMFAVVPDSSNKKQKKKRKKKAQPQSQPNEPEQSQQHEDDNGESLRPAPQDSIQSELHPSSGNVESSSDPVHPDSILASDPAQPHVEERIPSSEASSIPTPAAPASSVSASSVKDLERKNAKLSQRYEELILRARESEILSTETIKRKDSQIESILAMKRETEEEAMREISSRDSQLVIYRKSMDELSAQCKEKEAKMQEMQHQLEMALDEASTSSKSQSSLLQAAKLEASQLQVQIQEERVSHERTKEREANLSLELNKMEQQVSLLQRQVDEKEAEIERSDAWRREREGEASAAVAELAEYKQRMSRTLSARDQTIEELQQMMALMKHQAAPGANAEAVATPARKEEEAEDSDSNLLAKALQEENLMILSQMKALEGRVEHEKQALQSECSILSNKIRETESLLEKEQKALAKMMSALEEANQAMESMKLKVEKDRKYSQEQIRQRDAHILRLEKQAAVAAEANKPDPQQKSNENEKRMADQLLSKQAQVDALLQDKSNLQSRLDSALSRVREIELLSRATSSPASSATSAATAHLNRFGSRRTGGAMIQDDLADMEASSSSRQLFDSFSRNEHVQRFPQVAQRISSAASFLDQLTLDAGRVLRRSPLLRIGIVLYALALHLLISFVLMSSGSGASPSSASSNDLDPFTRK